VKNIGGTDYGGSGIALGEGTSYALTKGCRRAKIIGCTVRDVIDDTILAGASADSYNIVVADNIIEKTDYMGSAVSVYGSKYVTVHDNIIKAASDAGAIGLRGTAAPTDVDVHDNIIEVGVPAHGTLAYRGSALNMRSANGYARIKFHDNIIFGETYRHVVDCDKDNSFVEIYDNLFDITSRIDTGQTIRFATGTSTDLKIKNNILEDDNADYNVLLNTISSAEFSGNDLSMSAPSTANASFTGTIDVLRNIFNAAKKPAFGAGTFVVKDNKGYPTENSGITDAIATGATVAHGLAGTPTMVMVTAAESGPTDIYLSAVGATNFVINYGGGGNKTFYWQAEYKP
jgi:hypothetical protein